MIAKNPATPAQRDPVRALVHSVGLIFSSCIKINGAGKVPSFNALANSLAESTVNPQLI